jgi:hypothetical protein
LDGFVVSQALATKCWAVVDEVSYAQRLATALKRAAQLCEGKSSKWNFDFLVGSERGFAPASPGFHALMPSR